MIVYSLFVTQPEMDRLDESQRLDVILRIGTAYAQKVDGMGVSVAETLGAPKESFDISDLLGEEEEEEDDDDDDDYGGGEEEEDGDENEDEEEES